MGALGGVVSSMPTCQGTRHKFKTSLFLPRIIFWALAAGLPNCFIKAKALSIMVYDHGQDKEPMGLVKKSREYSRCLVSVWA